MNSLSVLIIDDDPGDAALIAHLLRDIQPPIFTTHAATLPAGLTSIEQQRPDVVLLDLHLPHSQGFETFAQFHGVHPELATVVLTGVSDPDLQMQLVAEGAQDFLVKGGFDTARLVTTLRHAVERQRLLVREREVGEQLARNERALQEALDREQAASDRLRVLNEMKSTFLSAVSHELRTPLTTITGFAATLVNRGDALSPERQRLLLERLLRNAHRLARLVNDLLDVDRLSRGAASLHLTRTEVAQLAARTLEQLEGSAGRVTVSTDHEVWADVDAPKVERIIENLVSNGLRHTPPDSELRVRVENEDGGVMIVVEDDGPGVPADLKHRLFQPFQQGHEAASSANPGVGIGLTLVAELARCHGGRAWVGDRPGGGAQFAVWLPQPAANQRDPRRARPFDTRCDLLEAG